MSINVMVNGWNESDDIAVNAPDVSMSVSGLHQVLYAAGIENKEAQGDSISADEIGDVIQKLKDLEKRIAGEPNKILLRARAINFWAVLSFANTRNRGAYWA